LKSTRFLVYAAAAVLIILCAGCGWTSGEPFSGEYNLEDNTPIAAVQRWFKSMEFIRSENDEGQLVPNQDNGRDFELFLMVVNPELLKDPSGQFIGMEQVNALRDLWNNTEWNVEFLDVQMELASEENGEATVELVSGGIRYIGKQFFDSPEYRQDSFSDKKGEVYLQWYDDPVNDPLLKIELPAEKAGIFDDIAGKGRWVVVGGLDFSEDEPWGETSQ
jgi:hypothetical protein